MIVVFAALSFLLVVPIHAAVPGPSNDTRMGYNIFYIIGVIVVIVVILKFLGLY